MIRQGIWFGIATSKYQFSVAPSTPFDGLLLKDPRLMHLEVQGCASWGAEGRDVLAGVRVRVRVRVTYGQVEPSPDSVIEG